MFDLPLFDLPIVVGEVYDNGKRDNVRQAARFVATQTSGLAFVPSAGLATHDEGTHFDTTSQLRLGRRFARAMLSLQGDNELSRSTVVCFGDSITNRAYGDFLPSLVHVKNINAGVGGHTSAQGLKRLEKEVLSQRPDIAVILFGTNDLRIDNDKVHQPIDKYKANLEEMVDRCHQNGIDVVVYSSTDRGGALLYASRIEAVWR